MLIKCLKISGLNFAFPRMILMNLLLIVGLSLTIPKIAKADELEPSCDTMSNNELMDRSSRMATMLRLSVMRADLGSMEDYNKQIMGFEAEAAEKCPTKKVYICGYDCAVERGRYFLFKARSLRLLSISIRGTPIANSTSQQFAAAAAGDRVMNDAKIALMATGVQGRIDGNEAFRAYVKKDAALTSMRAKLLMTTGDIYYARVSDNATSAIGYAVSQSLRNDAMPNDSVAGECNGDDVCAARKYYEVSMWEVTEAVAGLPEGADYTRERNDLEETRLQLRSRLTSIQRGFLFIGIDPYENSVIPMSELLGQLNSLRVKLKESEDRIEMMVKDWSVNKTGRQLQAIDEKRYASGRDIGLKTYKISVLEQQARQFAEDFSNKMQNVSTDIESLTYIQQLRELQFQLNKRVAEAQNDIRNLESRRSQDSLSLRQNISMEKRNELRWLINVELTNLNLSSQEQALEAQIAEYDLRTSRNKNRQAILANELQQKNSELQALTAEETIHNQRIEQLTKESTEVYSSTRAGVIASICQLEGEVKMLGGEITDPFPQRSVYKGEKACVLPSVLPEQTRLKLMDAVNAVRTYSIDKQIKNALIIRKCVMGLKDIKPYAVDLKTIKTVDGKVVPYDGDAIDKMHDAINCGDLSAAQITTTEIETAKSLKDASLASMDNRKKQLKEQLDLFKDHVTQLRVAMNVARAAGLTASTMASVAAATHVATAAIPTVIVHVQGLASGSSTSVEPGKAAKATFDTVSFIARLAMDVTKYAAEIIQEEARFSEQIKQLEDAINHVDYEQTVQELQSDQIINQIYGKGVDLNQRAQDAQLNGVMLNAEFSLNKFDLNASILKGIAEHSRLLIQLETAESQNNLITYSIAIEQAGNDAINARREIIASQQNSLNLEINELNRDNSSVVTLKNGALRQLEQVGFTKGKVNDLDNQSRTITDSIMKIFDEQKVLYDEKYTQDREHIERVLNLEKTNAKLAMENVSSILDKVGTKRNLLAASATIAAEYNAKVDALKSDILNDATHAAEDDKHNGDKSKVYLANDIDLSLLVRGVDDYLETKQRILEQANFVLAKLRFRYRTLTTTIGASGQADWTFVTSSDELERIASAICTKAAADHKDCDALRDAPFYDTTPVVFDYVFFKAIPATSALVRTLEEKGEVSFEVSPSSAYATESKRNATGWLTIGDEKFAAQDSAYLMDVRVAARYECSTGSVDRGQIMSVTHTGDGYIPVQISKTSRDMVWNFASGPERTHRDIIPNLSVDREATCVEDYARSWKSTTVREMPEKAKEFCTTQSDDGRSSMMFFGAPLYGRYKLSRDATNCPIRSLALTFIYTKRN